MQTEAGLSIAALYTKPGHLIRRAQQRAVALFMQECAPLDLTPMQYATLVAVRENPGVDATRVASLIAFDRATTGSVLDRLEAKALLTRRASAQDKRLKLLKLTPAGAKLLARADTHVAQAQQAILAPLKPSEQKTLMQLLRKLIVSHDGVDGDRTAR